jgi:hypothetical protein
MRNLLALVGLALVLFAGLGWYLGWYKVKTAPADPGHHNVNIDVNTKKISTDLHNGEQHLQQWLDTSKDGKSAPTKAGKDAPEKTGAVLAPPEPSGFPLDPPGAPTEASSSIGPMPGSSPHDAPFFNKKDTPGLEPLPKTPGYLP